MRDYWVTQYILQFAGWLYIAVVLIAVGLALLIPKRPNRKAIAGLVVLAILISPLVISYQQAWTARAKFRSEQAVAQALFQEHCKTAGEKIYKTVDNVEGIYLINTRKPLDTMDQFDPNDPAGDGAAGEGYLQSFLMGHDPSNEYPFTLSYENRQGAFQYVEISDAPTGSVIRYTDARPTFNGLPGKGQILAGEHLPTREARFGVEWTDLSTPEDRKHWIAGSRIRILDLHTQEILAERVGFVVDLGLGDKRGGRQPWIFARDNACPEFPKLHGRYPEAWGLTRNFVERVLHPREVPNA
jgi:hypothetical protein